MGEHSKQLYRDQRAEDEADQIGARFMDSPDVVGDMSRTYGQDLSSVRIHTGSEGSARLSGTGVDALAEGRDIFMGSAYQPADPASKGLLAHELAHTMQQTGGGGAEVSSPMGAAQGGMMDWFRKLFGKKKEPDMEISEPTLVEDGPFSVRKKNTSGSIDYRNQRSYALHQMLEHASPEQMKDPMLRQLVLEDFNQGINQRLKAQNGHGREGVNRIFRDDTGELSNFNMMTASMLPADLGKQAIQSASPVASSGSSKASLADPDAAIDFLRGSLLGNKELMDFTTETNSAFDGVEFYDTDRPEDVEYRKDRGFADKYDERSNIMVNNVMLRNVLNKYVMDFNTQYNARMEEARNNGTEYTGNRDPVQQTQQLMRHISGGKSDSLRNLRTIFSGMFRKKS